MEVTSGGGEKDDLQGEVKKTVTTEGVNEAGMRGRRQRRQSPKEGAKGGHHKRNGNRMQSTREEAGEAINRKGQNGTVIFEGG